MNAKKAATWVGVAVVIFAVLAAPGETGRVVHTGLDGIGAAWADARSFLGSVFG